MSSAGVDLMERGPADTATINFSLKPEPPSSWGDVQWVRLVIQADKLDSLGSFGNSSRHGRTLDSFGNSESSSPVIVTPLAYVVT